MNIFTKQKIFLVTFVLMALAACEKDEEVIGFLDTLPKPSPIEKECLPYEYLGENLVVNGSFEEDHKLKNNSWNVFESVGAWKVDRVYNDAGIEIQRGKRIGGLAPSDGHSKLELDSHVKNGFTASDAAIYQEIDTKASHDYILRFDYSPRVGGHETTNAAELYWDGNFVSEFNSQTIGWQTYTFRLAGSGTATKLMFRGHIDRDTVGAYLDNIVLKEVTDDSSSATEQIANKACPAE